MKTPGKRQRRAWIRMLRPSIQTNKAHFLVWPNLLRGRLNSDRRPARFGALLHRTLLPT
jgi:hypothetical protein